MRRRLLTFARQWPIAIMLTAVVIAQSLLIVAGAIVLRDIRNEVIAVATQGEARGEQRRLETRQALVCLLAQGHDHRDNTKHFHEQVAAALGFGYQPPAPPPLPDLPSGTAGCEPFTNGGAP